MGNSHIKASGHDESSTPQQRIRSEARALSSQFSLSHFVGSFSGRSLSVASGASVCSASRPWSRVSRKRWNEATLKNPLEASKTAWPVSNKESIFLPEFPITTDLLQKDFNILHTIAKGAFSEVYKVKQLSVDKTYALKVLSKGQVISENAVRQVKDEARIQQACGHFAFIVGAISRWQTKKRLYIVSEYIPCGELRDLIEKYNKLPEAVVKIFVAEIAIAIDFLHNAGVIYRDLKPENILLDKDYHIQLADFGLSKWLTLGGRTTTICGTIKYMAPEVLSREPYGHAVDWWSLGVITCRMLTGEFPTPAVRSRRSTETENGQLKDEGKTCDIKETIQVAPSVGSLPQSALELSSAARALLLRLLEVDAKRRLRSLRQLEQTAFYMGYSFKDVREMKVSPRVLLCGHFPGGVSEQHTTNEEFMDFDQIN